MAIGREYVAAPDGLTENWPVKTPLNGAPTGGPDAFAGFGGGTASRFTRRPSGSVASCVPSPSVVTGRRCAAAVAVTLWLPTVQVRNDPDNVATNGACVVDTNVVGG